MLYAFWWDVKFWTGSLKRRVHTIKLVATFGWAECCTSGYHYCVWTTGPSLSKSGWDMDPSHGSDKLLSISCFGLFPTTEGWTTIHRERLVSIQWQRRTVWWEWFTPSRVVRLSESCPVWDPSCGVQDMTGPVTEWNDIRMQSDYSKFFHDTTIGTAFVLLAWTSATWWRKRKHCGASRCEWHCGAVVLYRQCMVHCEPVRHLQSHIRRRVLGLSPNWQNSEMNPIQCVCVVWSTTVWIKKRTLSMSSENSPHCSSYALVHITRWLGLWNLSVIHQLPLDGHPWVRSGFGNSALMNRKHHPSWMKSSRYACSSTTLRGYTLFQVIYEWLVQRECGFLHCILLTQNVVHCVLLYKNFLVCGLHCVILQNTLIFLGSCRSFPGYLFTNINTFSLSLSKQDPNELRLTKWMTSAVKTTSLLMSVNIIGMSNIYQSRQYIG